MMHFELCKKQKHSQQRGVDVGCGVAEAPPIFQASLSYCIYIFFSWSFSFESLI
jgi:hypothetical protein